VSALEDDLSGGQADEVLKRHDSIKDRAFAACMGYLIPSFILFTPAILTLPAFPPAFPHLHNRFSPPPDLLSPATPAATELLRDPLNWLANQYLCVQGA
jgi:hypothetical protein